MISKGSCDNEILMLKIQLCITGINKNVKYIQIEKFLKLFLNYYFLNCYNITVILLYFDQVTAGMQEILSKT